MKTKNIFFTLILILCSYSIFGLSDKAGTTGFSFMKINYSARAMGMGNAFVGLSNDGDAVFHNPAGLTYAVSPQLKTTYMAYIDGMQGGSAVYTMKIWDDWKMAPFVQFLVSDPITRMDEDAQNLGTFYTSDMLIGVGFGKTIHDMMDAGFNLKYFIQKLDGHSASAVAVDIALLHTTQNPDLMIGATIKNLGMQLSHFTTEKYNEGMPIMLVFGPSLRINDKGYINLDICRPFDGDFFGRLGAEYPVNPHLTLRAGLDSRMNDYRGGDTIGNMAGISAGFGFGWNDYIIDYAVSSMGSLGFINQISVSYKFR